MLSKKSYALLLRLSEAGSCPKAEAPELLSELASKGFVSLRLGPGGTVAVITDAGRAALEMYEDVRETRRIAKRANIIAALAAAIAFAAFIRALVC